MVIVKRKRRGRHSWKSARVRVEGNRNATTISVWVHTKEGIVLNWSFEALPLAVVAKMVATVLLLAKQVR